MLLRNKHWLGIFIPVIIDRLQWCASQASLSVNWLVSVAGQPIYHAWKHGQVNRKDLLTERTHSSEQSNRILIAFASVNTRKWCMCIRTCVVSNTWAYHHQKNIRHKCHSDLSCRLTLTALSCGRRLLLVCSTFEYSRELHWDMLRYIILNCTSEAIIETFDTINADVKIAFGHLLVYFKHRIIIFFFC